MKKEDGRAISLAFNINVCFVDIPFQEDPATVVERLNDKDYLFGRPARQLIDNA